jgi:hypothetical protein
MKGNTIAYQYNILVKRSRVSQIRLYFDEDIMEKALVLALRSHFHHWQKSDRLINNY